MEIDDIGDLSDTSVNSNGNVCIMNYDPAVDDERNEPHSSVIERENESTSSQFLSPLQNLSASSLFNDENSVSTLVHNFLDEHGNRPSDLAESGSPFSNELIEAAESTNYIENEDNLGNNNDQRSSSCSVKRSMNECETLRILNESPNFDEEESQGAGSSAEQLLDNSQNVQTLDGSADFESENDDEIPQNCHHNFVSDSLRSTCAFDSQSREPLDSTDQLFAPGDMSGSTTSRRSIFENHPLFRGSRYSRFSSTSPLNLSSDADSFSARYSRLNVPHPWQLALCMLHRSRRRDLRHGDLLLPSRATAAMSDVFSRDGNRNLTERINDLRGFRSRVPYRRNVYLPRTSNERHTGSNLSTVFRPNHPRVFDTAGIHERTVRTLQSLLDYSTSSLESGTPERTSSCVRARSVSPTSANPWFSPSVHDDSLDDTADVRSVDQHFVNESRDNAFPRPPTPLPPVLSDDESPLTPNNFEDDLMTGVQSTAGTTMMSSRPTDNVLASVITRHVKEVPRTYDELNSELIQLLECPICFEYSTPPINQCLQGHIICNNCRQRVSTCPTCRNMFQESRNLIVEKVAALLRYPCKNAVTGCLETLYLLQKEQHEKACGFRHYICFIPMCNWRGYKPELLVHVQEIHESHVIHGSTVNLMIPITGQTKRVWLMSAFNELFYVIFFATLGILKGCVRFIGDVSKCDNFTYNISVTSEEEMLRNFNYTRTTHAYEETFENDMIDSYDLFSISHAQLNLFRKDTKAPIRVTIEEAHMRQRTGNVSSIV